MTVGKKIISIFLFACLIISSNCIMTLASVFEDVSDSSWYSDSVNYVYENGLMSGVGNNNFAPKSTVTRAMVAQILYRLSDSPYVQGGNYYKDVGENAWYTKAVNWAYEENIMSGYGNRIFGPNNPITREQLMVVLQRYISDSYKYSDIVLQKFGDYSNISGWAVNSVSWGVHNRILSGSGGMLLPCRGATRAELASILMRYCENILNANDPNVPDEPVIVEKTSITPSGNGYVTVGYSKNTEKRLKVRISKGNEMTTYDIKPLQYYDFCYSYGPGEYEVIIYENTHDSKYARVDRQVINVSQDEYMKSLITSSSHYNYKNSRRIENTMNLIWDNSKSDYDNCKEVYNYVKHSFNYDTDRAKEVKSGYFPDINHMFISGKGICLDFASMYATMVRSKGIPAQIVIGYYGKENMCHAWCKLLIEDKWIYVDPTFGATTTSSLSDRYFNMSKSLYMGYNEDYLY